MGMDYTAAAANARNIFTRYPIPCPSLPFPNAHNEYCNKQNFPKLSKNIQNFLDFVKPCFYDDIAIPEPKNPKNPFSQNYFAFSKNGHKKYVHFSIPQKSLPKKEFFLI